jgi:hypothetical protein
LPTLTRAGLPDFSWFKIPKRGEIYQMITKYTNWPLNISNGRKIGNKLVIKYTKIFHCKTPKIYPNWGFGFENKPSGNPGREEWG